MIRDDGVGDYLGDASMLHDMSHDLNSLKGGYIRDAIGD